MSSQLPQKNKIIQQVDIDVGDAELSLIRECIENRWLTEGEKTKKFSDLIKIFTQAEYVTFAPNGTLGLFLALIALDLPRGSEIIIPSFTFYASATTCIFAGLKPIFVDVYEDTFNMNPGLLEEAITKNTRAIMPVHIYGQACDMTQIMEIARKYNLCVIEDAAQGFGVRHRDKSAGTIGDVGVFSFFSDKVITTGEGAAVVSNDQELFNKILLMRNQGRMHSGTFIHPELGMNFRITDLQAAIGIAQMHKFSEILARKLYLYGLYYEKLKDVDGLRFMKVDSSSNLVPFRFFIRTKYKEKLEAHLQNHNIVTRSFFYPLHLQPKLKDYGSFNCPISEKLYKEGLCLPLHRSISEIEVDYICDVIKKFNPND